MMSRSRSGISPVVATVILVAIAIVIAIAVAFWATGLVGVFTRYEKIEITSAYAQPVDGGATYRITISAKNSGSSPATIDQVLINGVPVCEKGDGNLQETGTSPPNIDVARCEVMRGDLALNPGDRVQITITLNNAPAGVTVEVALHSASGKLYPYSVLLP